MRQSITRFAPAAVISMALLSLVLTPGCGSGPASTATPVAAPVTRATVPATVETPVTREVPVTVPVPVTASSRPSGKCQLPASCPRR